MANAEQRIAKWRVKTKPDRIKEVWADSIERMAINAAQAFNDIVLMEAEVRQVLDGQNVSHITYPFYLDFARELWALLRRGFSGISLAREVEVLLSKWEGRGLAVPVLEAIRSQVFNIGPVGP